MKGIHYTIRIAGLKTPEGTISLSTLMGIFDALLQGSERALRLSIEGASVKRGRAPAWLSDSLDFVIAGISKGSTTLELEAPTLAESAPEQVKQQNLWYSLPDPEDTALSLLAKSVSEATSDQLESKYYDRGVLGALLSFRSLFGKSLNEVRVTSPARTRDNFRIGHEELNKISRLEAQTPEPRAVVIAGLFDMIQHTGRQFQLGLEDGRKIPGKAESSFISEENMRTLWGTKVTIKGIAHFNPSGRMRFIEAQIVRPFEAGEEVFESIPEPRPPISLVEELKRKQTPKSPLSEVWGQWPGEESIEEILSVLRETSAESR